MTLASNPKRVLIVCLRRLGDVLLATPLAYSIRLGWPGTQIDWLVFDSTAGILEGNKVADRIVTTKDHGDFKSKISTLRNIVGRYDLAVSVQSGDRPTFFARLAASNAYTFASDASGGSLRDALMTGVVRVSDKIHRVDKVLQLTGLLGIKAHREVVPPTPVPVRLSELGKKYVVFHPGAAFHYKRLNAQAWRELYDWYASQQIQVIVTGGNSLSESAYIDQIFEGRTPIRLDGKLSWPQLSSVILGSRGFIGVDTSVTHLAAALGVATYAVFGPTDPVLWRPIGPPDSGNVKVIQAPLPCVPCQLEGCERHINSRSDCLDRISARDILGVINAGG